VGGVAAAVVGSVDGGVVDGGNAPKRLLGAIDVAAGVGGGVVEAVAVYRFVALEP
jgi:hypothetical protein